MAGALRPESSWVGKSLQSRPLNESLKTSKIIALLRGKSVVIARPEAVLQPGDRLLIIAPQQARTELAKHLTFTLTPSSAALPV
jgi:Trk K+ transport system NAD-binding subunit